MQDFIPACYIVVEIESVAQEGGENDKNVQPGLAAEGELSEKRLRKKKKAYKRYGKGGKKIKRKQKGLDVGGVILILYNEYYNHCDSQHPPEDVFGYMKLFFHRRYFVFDKGCDFIQICHSFQNYKERIPQKKCIINDCNNIVI